jgi:hypothetical protein
MKMDMIYVDSESVDQIGYDPDALETHVIFKNGGHYVYSDVTSETWDRFRDSTSKGGFVNQEFRGKGYPVRKL